ncbi:hypothetical protein AB0891_25610 [Streptomyces sp. NPDC007259]|uniref:Acb2/Tad1 domain-containing protein n=1 Tax=Streptomyces sp. NPDC007259 TaxID=3154319 RepID=UPI0034522EEE
MSEQLPTGMDRRFNHHAPDEDDVTRHEAVRQAARAMAELVVQVTPEGREQALALTNIEQAMFWANAAVAREGE